jgi:hypothetical protein
VLPEAAHSINWEQPEASTAHVLESIAITGRSAILICFKLR